MYPGDMLPRRFLPDQDLILCASLNRTMMTTNVHPLYLPQAVCWLNRTCAQVQRVKGLAFNALKVVSSALVTVTLFVHMIRVWNSSTWGVLGATWSLAVCITLIGGSFLTILSSERRNGSGDASAIVDPMSGVSLSQKRVTFIFLLATYVYTWLYYRVCGGTEVLVSWSECSDRRGPSLFPVVKWTGFVFVWINTIGFLRLLRVD